MPLLDTDTPIPAPPAELPIKECPYCPSQKFKPQHIFSFWHQTCDECGRTVAFWGPGMKEWQIKGITRYTDAKAD